MLKLVELSNTTHRHLKIRNDIKASFAKAQQIMRLRVSEIPQAATNMPIIYTRSGVDGGWVLSGLCGLVEQQNSFVINSEWKGTYMPLAMQTHPFYLIKSDAENTEYAIGINDTSEDFDTENGEPIFDDKGAPSLLLSRSKAKLEADIKYSMETHQFTQKLDALNLLKAVDLTVQFASSGMQKFQGIYIIDESRLKLLSDEQLLELNQLGYLIPIHAMLISLYQLNSLIRNNNEVDPNNKITQLKMEVAKDNTGY